jgi:soluble lytic murein transglycosylase-like protein
LRRRAAAAVLALVGSTLLAGPALAAPPLLKALTSTDAAAYAAAFNAEAAADFSAAADALAEVSDKSLIGYVDFERLMSPATHATYGELKAWLERYGDLPVADRVLRLARQRKPRGAPDPQLAVLKGDADVIPMSPATAGGQAAREAYYSGDVETAWRLATQSGERWIAGLSGFRLKKYGKAAEFFRSVATDPNENEWLRAGGAYWAARALIAEGHPEQAPQMLAIAARSPATFYGMLAERQLGLEPAADPQAYALAQAGFAPPPPAPDAMIVKASYTRGGAEDAVQLLRTDPRARRAAALMQIGRTVEAAQELKSGLLTADGDDARAAWTTLAIELNTAPAAQLRARRAGFDPDDYPTPQLQPAGGFTLDKALVYAVARQESRFDPNATSGVGAVGIMQLMPATAAQVEGDDQLAQDASPLYDAAFNLRAGQDYLRLLLDRATDGDVLRAVAAYNGGPGALLRAEQLAGDADPLLLMESLPAAETRGYVEKVMASYWIYRRMFGEANRSLDALAGGAPSAQLTADRPAA